MGGMGFLKLISQAFPRPLPQSLALFFARHPLSERLEQATVIVDLYVYYHYDVG